MSAGWAWAAVELHNDALRRLGPGFFPDVSRTTVPCAHGSSTSQTAAWRAWCQARARAGALSNRRLVVMRAGYGRRSWVLDHMLHRPGDSGEPSTRPADLP